MLMKNCVYIIHHAVIPVGSVKESYAARQSRQGMAWQGRAEQGNEGGGV